VTVFEPVARAMLGEAEPEATPEPFTVIVAWLPATVGVRVNEVTLFATDNEY